MLGAVSMTDHEILERALRDDLAWQYDAGWDTTAVLAAAADEGVEALLWEALRGGTGAALDLQRGLDARVRTAAARDLLVQREMCRLLDQLAAAGVRALVVKGCALAYTVYRQPWHRPRVDTDLLIARDHLDEATRVLVSMGYTRSDAIATGTVVSHQIAFERVDAQGVSYVLDLHWKIVNPQVVANALEPDELWERRQMAPALGPAAAVPDPVDSVLLASIHRLAHHQGHDRLIWFYDLRLLTSRFTPSMWDVLVTRACERSVAGLCLDALERARERAGVQLPDDVVRGLERAAPAEPSRRFIEGPVKKIDILESDLRTLPSWGARLRLLREHAFPPAGFIRQRYGVKSRLLLPALYLHRLLAGAAKWMR